MAHKVLIGGAGYGVSGGKTLVNGTAYTISHGKTLVGGTAYNIDFNKWKAFGQLMQNAVVLARTSANSGSRISINVRPTSSMTYPLWCFSIHAGDFSVYRINAEYSSSGAPVALYKSSQTSANITQNGSVIYYTAKEGVQSGDANYVYCAILALFSFPGYTATQVDSILSSLRKKGGAGSDVGQSTSVTCAVSRSDTIIAHSTSNIGISCPLGTTVFGTWSSYPSLISVNNGIATLMGDNAIKGGSIILL